MNGEWFYRNYQGNIDYSFTGLAQNPFGWWYINNGMVDFTYNGYASNEYGTWRIEGGKVVF